MKNSLILILVFGLSGCSRSNKKDNVARLFNQNDILNANSEDESSTEDSEETGDESSTDVKDESEADVSDKNEDEIEQEYEAAYQSMVERYGRPSDNFGFIKGNSYVNPILGLGCTFDENWTLYSYDEIADTDDDMYDLVAESMRGLNNVRIMIEENPILSRLSESDIAKMAIESVEPTLNGYGLANIESEVISLDFAGKSHAAVYATAEITPIPFHQCQLLYTNTLTNKLGSIALITVTSFSEDEIMNILDMFYSVDGIDDMFNQENNSDKKAAIPADAETGKNIYEISALQATVSLPEKYHVYSLDNPFTEEMCQSQGLTVEQMTQYLNLVFSDMVVVPADEDFRECSFEMDVKVKSGNDFGIDNLKDFSKEDFELYAGALIIGFDASGYEVLETDQVKYVVFDCVLMTYERRYATIINGDRVYFIGYAGEGMNMTEENYQALEDFAASLKLNAGSGR